MQNYTSFHNLQFNLLGNTLESLFLPSAIVIVEGKTDKPFIEKCIEMEFPDRGIIVTESQGNIKARLHSVKEALGGLYKSPFRPRIFAILDEKHTKSDPAELERIPSDLTRKGFPDAVEI